jgi:hypothetical protein
MNAERSKVFREIEPPPGGPEAFARRLDNEARARPFRAYGLALAAAAAALVAVVLFRSFPNTLREPEPSVASAVYDAREFDRLLGRTRPPTELAVVRNDEVKTLVPIASSDPSIRIYQIE